MNAGGNDGGFESNINMTPMIDVLLVLIIIFMVVQVGLQKGVSVQVPPTETKTQTQQNQQSNQIVLEVLPGPKYMINKHPISAGQLQERLHEVFAPRVRKVLFIKGAEQIAYGQVVHAIDAARAAGLEIIGLVPRQE